MRDAASVHPCANKEEVELLGEVLLVEEKLEEQPKDNHAHVDPDGIVPEYGKYERY